MMMEATSAAIVQFGHYSSEHTGGPADTVSFAVPDSLLWTGAGLKKIYEMTRASFLIHPGQGGFDEEAWETWHLVSIKDGECFCIEKARKPCQP